MKNSKVNETKKAIETVVNTIESETGKKFNVTFAFNASAKREMMSLSAAVKAVVKSLGTTEGKIWKAKFDVKNSDVTVKNVSDFWYQFKIDNKLAYSYYPEKGQRIEKVKTKFGTYDVIKSIEKMKKA